MNEIIICSDSGRPIRPLFYIMDNKLSYERELVENKLKNNECIKPPCYNSSLNTLGKKIEINSIRNLCKNQ